VSKDERAVENTYLLAGERYSDTVPDTLELAGRGALAITGIGGQIDSLLLSMCLYGHYCAPTPHFVHHHDHACDPKALESLHMMRMMCGSNQYADPEAEFRVEFLSRVDDGLQHEMIAGMARIMVRRDDYAYYPEKGGWGQACTYPRSRRSSHRPWRPTRSTAMTWPERPDSN